ncbi:MAG: hypothetical protein PVH00_01915 [Gemmatimonadota bacterium]|jgi:hypothetical protein
MRRAAAGRPRPRAAIAAIIASLAIAATAPDSALARQAHIWTPDTRTVVTAGGNLTALAVNRTEVFAATQDVVLVYDVARREWRPPITVPAALDAPITALGVDPTNGDVWIGTGSGDLVRGLPGFSGWETVAAPVRGGIQRIVTWPADASTFVLSAGEWWRIEWASSFADAIGAASVPGPVRARAADWPDDPYLAAARSSLGLDPELQRWPITDVVRGIEPDEFWIATGGGGLLHFNARRSEREWLRFGLVARGAATVAWLGDRLWFGGDGRGPRNGVASATPDLGSWQQYDARLGGPAGFVAEIVRGGDRLWFAAEDGLYRFDDDRAGDRRAWTRFTSQDGLPSDRTRSVLHYRGRIWVGTDQGLVALDSLGRRIAGPLLAGGRTSRLAATGDTLWIASARGLRSVTLSDSGLPASEPVTPVLPGADPASVTAGPVLDLATGSATWFLSPAGIFRLGPEGLRGPVRDVNLDRIGPAFRLASDGADLWVAGRNGIARLDGASGAWEVFTVPADIPSGPVLDVLPLGADVWAATPAGAVRLRWR